MSDAGISGQHSRWYLATTRNNAIGTLAAGLVMPALGHPKYYPDIHSLSPGRIVLTPTGARPDWFTVTEQGAADIPVLLELHADVSGDEYGRSGSTVIAAAAVVPTSRLAAVHVATSAAADEFTARRYANIDPAGVELLLSPGLFTADVPASVELRPWLTALPSVDHPAAEDIRTADAIAGASLMGCICPALTTAELAIRRTVLQRLLEGGRSVEQVVADALGVSEWLSSQADADRALLLATVKVLAALSPATRLGARRVLADIRALVGEAAETAAIEANLARVESILKAQADLRPLTERSGLRSAKALLLFLLRPSPEETPSWSADMTGDPLAILGACVLSGLAAGARLLPGPWKRDGAGLRVAEIAADRINASSPHEVELFSPSDRATLALSEDEQGRVVLRLGDDEVASALADPVDGSHHRAGTVAPPTGKEDALPADVAELLQLLQRADLTDPVIARLCAAVCERLDWADVVETAVEFTDSGFRVQGRYSIFPGTPPVTLRIDRDSLLERIAGLKVVTGSELEALRKAVAL